MNIILILNNNLSKSKIEEIINQFDIKDNKLIIKLINGFDLSFDSYKTTFSLKSLDIIKDLKLNKNVIFNFDVYSNDVFNILKKSNIDNLFLDIYVNKKEDIIYYNEKTENIRKDLNIIDDNFSITSHFFDNVDYYFSINKINKIKFNPKEENINFIEYLTDYSSTLIYHLNKSNMWDLYLFSKNRFFKTNIEVKEINIESEINWIKKYLRQKSIKNKNCLSCENKVSCLKQDLFIYFSELEICDIKDNYVKQEK